MAREVIAEQLSVEPYRVTQITGGLKLLEKFDKLKPDVILMDVMMPIMNGYDVCQEIKQNPARSHIPVILVTALNSREDMLKGLETGADEFLSKPVNGAELRARVRTMLRIKNQYDSLQSVMQLREDLAHMLIHDMRNPLTVATLYNNILLKRNQLSPRDKEYAVLVRDGLRNLAGFLDEILTTAKMEEGLLKPTSQPNDISQLITNVVEGQREVARLQGLQLMLDLPQERRSACIDATLFKRVLDNLLSNAFKYAPDQSQITLRLRYLGDENNIPHTPSFRLQVMDQGPGIAPENYDRIFNKYEVVTLKQSGQEQIGLGLAFCKLVVEAHNGRIYVSPNLPQGAIFNVEM
ncbi:MAG: hybrid sensor histidine kinase/response regulator [Anaerolineaceae bacterium]|nr:hybrid sensor histidine kinase/response regulator [Anaerolineaceae bacterium]